MSYEVTRARRRALLILSGPGIPQSVFSVRMWPTKKGASPRCYLLHLKKLGLADQNETGWFATEAGLQAIQ